MQCCFTSQLLHIWVENPYRLNHAKIVRDTRQRNLHRFVRSILIGEICLKVFVSNFLKLEITITNLPIFVKLDYKLYVRIIR